LVNLVIVPTFAQWLLYPVYIACGVGIMYSVMIALAATSVWLGRNQTLYDFWFYITNFSRYPREIYAGALGTPMQIAFTYLVPVLVVINVPARLLAKPLDEQEWPLALFTIVATIASLAASRWVFRRAMLSYRSASS
jgi:ABC-2 type transport system permease protein